MSSSYSVTLVGPAPWGFRLQGGKDFSMPLTISRLTEGGKAAQAHISVGDVVLSIDGIPTNGMNHLEAQNKIKACTGNLKLTLQKHSSIPKDATVPKEVPLEIIKPVPIVTAQLPPPTTFTSPAPSTAFNKTARPFGGDGSVGVVTSSMSALKVASIPSASSAFTPASSAHTLPPTQPQPPFPVGGASSRPQASSTTSTAKQGTGRSPFPPSSSPARVTGSSSAPVPPQPSVYNTPINLYSNEKACEVAMGQRRGLLESLGRPEHHNGKTPPRRSPRKPITEVDTEVHHVPSHGDASKKRLIEDTEDWHPRSGTTQSRSFRILAQITGTENHQGEQSDTGKSEVLEEVQPSTHVISPMKTMTKASTSAPRNGNPAPFKLPSFQDKPATWQSGNSPGSGLPKSSAQRGQVAPSLGCVNNSGPKLPPSSHSAHHPHPMGQDSLVQRAERMPAGTRTPMCGFCNNVIRGPFLVALGKSWHPEEFTCAHCHTSLADVGFVQERGSVYCEHCYEEFFAPICGQCQHKILGEVINALKQTWHVNCFLCVSCKQPIRNNTFHLEDGQPYCEKDYYNLFGVSCHGCDFPIEAGDKFLEALGFNWHDTCFVCSVCNTSLEGQAFFSKKDKPLCKKHAHTVKV